jgi:hypothetical protein
MFSRPMQVSAEDVRISRASEAAVVVFEQRWSAATYSDVGLKQLVLVERDEALLIGREEMLTSRILWEGTAGAPDPALFMLVVDVGGPHVVFATTVDEGAGRGPLSLVARADPAVATRAMDSAALDESVHSLIGTDLELFGAEGLVCSGRVGAPKIVHRVVPHFGTVQHWNGDFGERPRTEAEIAVDVWELGAGGAFVAAPLLAEGCEGALWARALVATPPAIYTPSPLSGASLAEALRAFRALPAHAAIQRDFRSYGPGHSGSWDSHGGAIAAVFGWRHPATGHSVVTVRARSGAGCAEFYGAAWGLFVEAASDLVPRTDPNAPGDFEPRSIIDLDGDGLVEVVIEDGLLRPAEAGGFTRVLSVTPPYLDCDC